jgi:membrane complex biogenesis BtpA family protein
VNEAKALSNAGFNALILENMHDIPYLRAHVGPEITACMSVVASEVRKVTQVPLGIQILAAANEAALSVAQAVDAQFIRAEAFVFSHVADEGMIDACAGPLLRLRRELGADKIKIFADIKKKHSAHAITSDVSIAETAHAAEFFGADGVIVTGTATGSSASPKELKEVKKATKLPVWIGSGITPKNLNQFKEADGFIVGSYLKKNGVWDNPLDPSAIEKMMVASKKYLKGQI